MQTEFKFIKENIKVYEACLKNEEKSSATIEKYIRDIQHFYDFLSKEKVVTKEVMIEYKKYLTTDYAVNSINTMLTAANGFLEFMGYSQYRVKLLKKQRQVFGSEEKELTKSDYMRLLKASNNKKDMRLHLILQTICATGIRIGELKHITIHALCVGKSEVYNKGKSRTIFIPKVLREKLKKYAKDRGIKNGSIFVTRSQQPVNRSNIWTEMKKLCTKAGVAAGKVFPHNLRHLFARTYYKIEKDIMKLADILGHSSIETTRVYIMTTGKEHERQIAKLGLFI